MMMMVVVVVVVMTMMRMTTVTTTVDTTITADAMTPMTYMMPLPGAACGCGQRRPVRRHSLVRARNLGRPAEDRLRSAGVQHLYAEQGRNG